MIRIGIVDDHTIVRRAMTWALSDQVDLRVVAEAANAAEAASAAASVPMEVMVVDLVLPGSSGVEAIAEIRRVAPELHVLVYSSHPEELYGASLANMGVRGYVSKDQPVGKLIEAIRTVALGGVFMSRQVRAHVRVSGSSQGKGPHELHESLSPREMEVFLKLARGARLSEVAAELGVSVKTASTYRSRVLTKLDMTQNTELTRYAMAHHLIT